MKVNAWQSSMIGILNARLNKNREKGAFFGKIEKKGYPDLPVKLEGKQ